MQPQKFLTFSSTNWNIIEKIFRDELSVFFLLKMTSRTCFFGSGMKIIFHWKAQLFISFGSLVRSLACLLGILTVENRDASLAKNLELHWRLSDKSLLHVRNKRTKHPKERCVKSVHIWSFSGSFSGPYFPVFSPNAGNTKQKNSKYGRFSYSAGTRKTYVVFCLELYDNYYKQKPTT